MQLAPPNTPLLLHVQSKRRPILEHTQQCSQTHPQLDALPALIKPPIERLNQTTRKKSFFFFLLRFVCVFTG